MLRINKFTGLITRASPYAVPPGGSQSQVNFVVSAPGEIRTRGGMAGIRFKAGRLGGGVVEQVFPISGGYDRPDRAVVIDSNGEIEIVDGATL